MLVAKEKHSVIDCQLCKTVIGGMISNGSSRSMASKVMRFFLIIYVTLSLVYTTDYFIPQKISSRLAIAFHRTSRKPETTPNEEVLYWKPSYAIRPNAAPVPLSSDLFLSKAFAESHAYAVQDKDDFKIVPNYYRASGPINNEDITITTLVTQDRFRVFQQLVETYQGPISVTIHVPTEGNGTITRKMLDALHKLYTSSPSMALRVDVHLALARSHHARRFNTWRNAARFLARTEFVMMLDVDFFPCTDFRTRVLISMKTAVGNMLRSGMAALVVPAFEYVNPNEGKDVRKFPRDKDVSDKYLSYIVCLDFIGLFHFRILENSLKEIVLLCSIARGYRDTTAQTITIS